MNLTSPQPPQGTNLVAAAAMRSSTLQKFAAGGGGGAPVAIPAAPHRVFKLNRDDLVQNRGIAAVHDVGWRMYVLNGQNVWAAVTFSGGGAAPAQFQGVHFGPFVESSVRGITTAEAANPGTSPSYELRILEIPVIHLVSLWLSGAVDNFFVPLKPAPPQFQAEKLYTEADFFAAAVGSLGEGVPPSDAPQGAPPAASP